MLRSDHTPREMDEGIKKEMLDHRVKTGIFLAVQAGGV
jgi:hypothetical protein